MFERIHSRLAKRGIDHEDNSAILEISGLSAAYNGLAALEDISFQLEPGERVALIGPNGAGKSTLMKIIAGVLPASSGEVRVFGQRPSHHICIAYVPQRSQVDWNFPVTISDVVMMGRVGQIGLLRWPKKSDWELVARSLEQVGMSAYANRQISELSGGQQHRVFIAQALAQQADLILLDEPLTGLDTPAMEAIFRILDLLQRRGVNVMVATHDLSLASRQFDRVMLLNRRLLGFGPPEQIITPERLLSAYGSHMHVMQAADGRILMIEDQCHEGTPDKVDSLG